MIEGIIGKKLGMTQFIQGKRGAGTGYGNRSGPCAVTQVKTQ